MSRGSDAKKARRRKRQAARDSTWMPTPEFDQALADEDRLDSIDAAIADIDDWVAPRGWVLDTGDDAGLVSWYYPPSAVAFDDDDRESVTRMWIRIVENDDEAVLEFGALLVGFGSGDEAYVLDPDRLADGLAALESYRAGQPVPALD